MCSFLLTNFAGNKALHELTSRHPMEMMVVLGQLDKGCDIFALYSSFKITGPAEGYALQLGQKSSFVGGNAGFVLILEHTYL